MMVHRDAPVGHWLLSRKMLMMVGLTLLFLAWPYVYCVLAVAYNYAWWVVFSGSVQWATPQAAAAAGVATPASAATELPVPKLLHQTWKDTKVPEKWRAAQKSCQVFE